MCLIIYFVLYEDTNSKIVKEENETRFTICAVILQDYLCFKEEFSINTPHRGLELD